MKTVIYPQAMSVKHPYVYFEIRPLQRIIEIRYIREAKNRYSIQSDRSHTDRRIYGFKTVLTYYQRGKLEDNLTDKKTAER